MGVWAGRVFGVLVVVSVIIMSLQMMASEYGEVVIVTTHGAEGESRRTRLWIVDYDGSSWLRASQPSATWLARIRHNPNVRVTRDQVETGYRAQPRADMRETINGLMEEKYGWAENYIGFIFGREAAVPIRLLPLAAVETPESE